MGSYSSKMQLSYYESIDPLRLYQLYSIPSINIAHRTAAPSSSSSSNAQQIISPSQLAQIQQTVIDSMQSQSNADHTPLCHKLYHRLFSQQILCILKDKQVQTEREHRQTVTDCHRYLLSCVFAKQLDLKYNIGRAKPFLPRKLITDAQAIEFINNDVSRSIFRKYYQDADYQSSLMHDGSTFNEYTEHHPETVQNNMSGYITMSVDTTMCLNCNGQIPTVQYMQHIEQCYDTEHTHYEQKNDIFTERNAKMPAPSLSADEILFSSKYQAVCVPPNPLETKVEEQSESDAEAVSALCPPDINDRRKVVASLVKSKQNRFGEQRKTMHTVQTSSGKQLEIFEKMYASLIPQQDEEWPSSSPSASGSEDDATKRFGAHSRKKNESDEDDEDEEDEDDDDDDDDDIPIAQNIRNQKHNESERVRESRAYNLRTRSSMKTSATTTTSVSPKLKREENEKRQQNESRHGKEKEPQKRFRDLQGAFKTFYRRKKVCGLKQKMKAYMKVRKNANKLVSDTSDRYCKRIEADKQALNKLYGMIINHDRNAIAEFAPFSRYAASLNYSKHLLTQLMECGDLVKTKHCGFVYEEIKRSSKRHEAEHAGKETTDCEQDHEGNEQKTMRMEVDQNENDDEHESDATEYECYCHAKLNANGLCAIHKHWRRQTYKQLVERLTREIEQIFVCKCMIAQTEERLMEDEKLRESAQIVPMYDTLLNSDNRHKELDAWIRPCVSPQVDAQAADIEYLLPSPAPTQSALNVLQHIQHNAVMYQP
eukprot:CAMPEP_0197049704 /NCGR_PEP_ID=MMETSP1384-20130603/24777_1 /TAXON_ID=29189 /ORGANISM="Ammonia sp." /LENGTH=765 /DNA_ID=CAMNT_0042482021 /DNA_START=231 /DNA_END=2528 /DNA_ORIENTATION=-